MTQILEREIVLQVANIALEQGFEVTLDPGNIPTRNSWKTSLASLVTGRRYHPDILIESGPNFALVEVNSRPILLGGVTQVREYEDHFSASVVLCVPDDSFWKTPGSVKEYAVAQGVRICPLSKIAEELNEILR